MTCTSSKGGGKFRVDLLIHDLFINTFEELQIDGIYIYICVDSLVFYHRFAACWISPPNSGIPDLAVFAGVMFEMGAFSPTMGTTT